MMRDMGMLALTGVLVAACGPVGGERVDTSEASDEESGDEDDGGATSRGGDDDDDDDDDAPTATGDTGDDEDDDDSGDGGPICVVGDPDSVGFCDFPPPPECGPGPFGCDPGEKCNPLGQCEPLPPDAGGPGDPCNHVGDGDDCGQALTCVYADRQPQGVCLDACSFEHACEEGWECTDMPDGDDACLEVCDPLTPACPEGSGCIVPFEGDPSDARCSVPAPEVLELGAPCVPELTAAAQCGPGLWCSFASNTCAVPCDPNEPPAECMCVAVFDSVGECWSG